VKRKWSGKSKKIQKAQTERRKEGKGTPPSMDANIRTEKLKTRDARYLKMNTGKNWDKKSGPKNLQNPGRCQQD